MNELETLLEWHPLMRLKSAVYDEKSDKLTLNFIHLMPEIDQIKAEIDAFITQNLSFIGTTETKFQEAYIDEDLLHLKFKNLLMENFGVLLVGLEDEDIRVSFNGEFQIELAVPANVGAYIRAHPIFKSFMADLYSDYFAEFIVTFRDKQQNTEASLENLEKYMEGAMPAARVNKAMHIRSLEYYLGQPIRERPIRIEHLVISQHPQTIAGKIMFLTARKFKKQTEDGEIEKPYWTFVLDDGKSKVNCVYFPTVKGKPLFEKLTDGTAVALVGIYGEKNGRTSFVASGVSFCEL